MNKISDDILYKVEKPARYIGGELNSVYKDKNSVDVRYAFCFPDVYEVGMSCLGLKILYRVLNSRKNVYCERVFNPWPDMEKIMRDNNIPLYALESKDPLNKFDLIGFTLQYEMCYTTVLNMLDMAGIPLRASERGDEYPIVMCGGSCGYNPEPLYDIPDMFLMGEGEQEILDVVDLYNKMKGQGKKKFLREAAKIDGVYVPSLYDVTYNDDGTIKSFEPKYDDVPKRVKKRIVNSLNDAFYPEEFIVPYTEVIFDRAVVETFRGCTRGCRFCQAGMIYRPLRERTVPTLLELADRLLKSTGYDEISLMSLSICDYSDIENLVYSIIEKYKEKKIAVSLPSLRIDSFSVELIKEIQKVRKTGLTFAPEAGSQRMRDVINKGVTEEDLMRSVRSAFESGWTTIKLYFMLGLPYETLEDAKGIAELSEKVCNVYYSLDKSLRKRGLKVNVSTSMFVPKPFTPFQWAPQEREDKVMEKVYEVKDNIKRRCISYSYHSTPVSYLEAIFARGDRKLCDVLISAFKKGAKLDTWAECFKPEAWKEAFKECNVDGDFYAYRERSYDEILPWDFVDVGVSKEYLISENEKAKKGILTKDCRKGCNNCGVNKAFKDGKCFDCALSDKF